MFRRKKYTKQYKNVIQPLYGAHSKEYIDALNGGFIPEDSIYYYDGFESPMISCPMSEKVSVMEKPISQN